MFIVDSFIWKELQMVLMKVHGLLSQIRKPKMF